MTMLAGVIAGILAVASLGTGGLADAATEIPHDSPWYKVDQDGNAGIHFYYAYSST